MVTVDLQLAADQSQVPDKAEIQSLIDAALRGADQPANAEVCVRVVEPDEMQALNRDYRGADKPTNVLSFPADAVPGLPEVVPLLGDIVVCADVVSEEAAEQGKATADHWAHMIVHGTLHLLGYDHEDDAEAERMEGLETDILAARGIANPYASS